MRCAASTPPPPPQSGRQAGPRTVCSAQAGVSSFQPRQGQGLSASLTAVDAVERLFCLAPQRTCMHVLYVTARGGRTWMHM